MAVVLLHARVPEGTPSSVGRTTVQDVLEKIARVQQWTGLAAVCALAGILFGLR